ncbi:MAG: hypothetical protein KatS3mg008_1315 [Acidimicrobiales bacterium]|nr:MAG: hypothetical protein KatS3mg008_1315 [Acidimicrobiales bacterium]
MVSVAGGERDNLGSDLEGGPGAGQTFGIVDRIEDGVAIVLVGNDLEEWDFPAHMLPPEAQPEDVLILEGWGRDFKVVGIEKLNPTIEARLGRAMIQKKRIQQPLPRREPPPKTPELRIEQRVSRYFRDIKPR